MDNETETVSFDDKLWWKIVWFAKNEYVVERIVYAERSYQTCKQNLEL